MFAGLRLQSDLKLDRLQPWDPARGDEPSIIVRMADRADFMSEEFRLRHAWPRHLGGMSIYAAESGAICLRFQNKTAFKIVGADGPACIEIDTPSSAGQMNALLLNQVLPRVLAHRGALVLHAALIEDKDGAILLIGETGTGKSTLSAALMQRGADLLSDDCCVVTNTRSGAFARPTYRSLRLREDSARQLIDQRNAEEPPPDWKREMRLRHSADTEPVRIDRIYVLTGEQSEHVSARILPKPQACLALVRNALRLDVTDTRRAAEALNAIARLVDMCPVGTLVYPRRYAELGQVCEFISEDLRNHYRSEVWI